VHREVDFAKRSLAQDSANAVELASCRRGLIELFEMKAEHLNQLLQVSIELQLLFVALDHRDHRS